MSIDVKPEVMINKKGKTIYVPADQVEAHQKAGLVLESEFLAADVEVAAEEVAAEEPVAEVVKEPEVTEAAKEPADKAAPAESKKKPAKTPAKSN